jgi:hypothetical protein
MSAGERPYRESHAIAGFESSRRVEPVTPPNYDPTADDFPSDSCNAEYRERSHRVVVRRCDEGFGRAYPVKLTMSDFRHSHRSGRPS